MSRASVRGAGQGLHGGLTTTGAVCISSLPNANQGGKGVLRLGDKTTPCPRCGKVGVLVESLPSMQWMGIATVLDGAKVHCDCPDGSNRLIAPLTTRTHSLPPDSIGPTHSTEPPQRNFAPSTTPAPVGFNHLNAQEPGFYIAPKSMTGEALEAMLFPMRDSAVMNKFRALNPNLSQVKAGSMIVLSDPNNTSCTYQESQLMQAAQHVEAALEPLTPDEADFLLRHGAEIASFIGPTSTWLGVSAQSWKRT